MKNALALLMVALLLVSGMGAGAGVRNNNVRVKTERCSFSPVQLLENTNDIQVQLPEATSWITTTEGYQLPAVTRVYTFPFKTMITHVSVDYSDIQELPLPKPVQQSSPPEPDDAGVTITTELHTSQANMVKPSFKYTIATGLNGETEVNYLALHLYPVAYNASAQLLNTAGNAVITISYILPSPAQAPTTQYQLLIIAARDFVKPVQPLVAFKESKGITTKVVTPDDACQGTYFPAQGRDCPEKMKYFIKNAIEQWGTKYVLLIGGRYDGVTHETWWVPVRYSALNDGGEGSYLTDLYFSDIYNPDGSFSSWDSNNNGIFAEWNTTYHDVMDMFPDVGVGRLPCTSSSQVRTMVEKIITYETTTYGAAWFKRFVGVAGDTYPDPYVNDSIYEGEMATNQSYAQLKDLGFNASFLWTSNGRMTGPDSVITELSKGCGFVHFSGHGNPMVWATHPPNNNSWVDGPNSFQMRKLSNGDEQPIVIVGGCHNNQFNTSLLEIVQGVLKDGLQYFKRTRPFGEFWYNEWVPRCWGWAMASQKKGGAIAVIANTGLGYGTPGDHTLWETGRFLEWLFFKAYHDGKDKLGETHAADLIYYMIEYPPMDNQIDCKVVQEWALFGDPSLQIGGYAP
jgi:hypothetical protein